MRDASPEGRFPFRVMRAADWCAVEMELGQDVSRVRIMSPAVLRRVGEACRRLLDEAKGRIPETSHVPLFPASIRVVTGGLPGVCRITLGCHRLSDGEIERVMVLYDADDDAAPVLALVEEQIDEFIRQT